MIKWLPVIAFLLFVIWWDSAPKKAVIPEAAIAEMTNCRLARALEEKAQYTREEFEHRGSIIDACKEEQRHYIAEHGTGISFLTPPIVIEKWFED